MWWLLWVAVAVVVIMFVLLITEVTLNMNNVNLHAVVYPQCYRSVIGKECVGVPHPDDFPAWVEAGRRHTAKKRIIIGFLAQNLESQLDHTRQVVEALGGLFQDYRVVVFENDSTDNTRDVLSSWDNVDLIRCCDMGDCECELGKSTDHWQFSKVNKLRLLVQYRNRLLEHIKKKYDDWDYVVMMDADLEGGVYVDGFLSGFAPNRLEQWDAMIANGVSPTWPSMTLSVQAYDTFAFLNDDRPQYRCTTAPKDIMTLIKAQMVGSSLGSDIRKAGHDMVPVKSAFNGMAVYKLPMITAEYNTQCVDERSDDLNYLLSSCSLEDVDLCEHVCFHRALVQNDADFRIVINPLFYATFGNCGGPRDRLSAVMKLFSG